MPHRQGHRKEERDVSGISVTRPTEEALAKMTPERRAREEAEIRKRQELRFERETSGGTGRFARDPLEIPLRQQEIIERERLKKEEQLDILPQPYYLPPYTNPMNLLGFPKPSNWVFTSDNNKAISSGSRIAPASC